MKKTLFTLITAFLACFLVSSCSDGEETELTILGDWHLTEWTLTTGDDYIDGLFNGLYQQEIKKYDIVRTFSNSSYSSNTIDRENGNIIRKKEGTYRIEPEQVLAIDDENYGGTVKSKFLLSGKILTTNREINIQDLRNLADELGIDPHVLPNAINGTLKMKEAR